MQPRRLFTERKPPRNVILGTPKAGSNVSTESVSKSGRKIPDGKRFAFLAEQLGEYRATIRRLKSELENSARAAASAQESQPSPTSELEALRAELQKERKVRLEAEAKAAKVVGRQLAQDAIRESLYQSTRSMRNEAQQREGISSTKFYSMVSDALHRRNTARKQRDLHATHDGATTKIEPVTPTSSKQRQVAGRNKVSFCDIEASVCVSAAASSPIKGGPGSTRASATTPPRAGTAETETEMRQEIRQCPVTPGVFFRALAQDKSGRERAAVARAAARGDRGAVEAIADPSNPAGYGASTLQTSRSQADDDDDSRLSQHRSEAGRKGELFSRFSSQVAAACRKLDYHALNRVFEQAAAELGTGTGTGAGTVGELPEGGKGKGEGEGEHGVSAAAWLCKLADSRMRPTGKATGGTQLMPGGSLVPVLVYVAGGSSGGSSAGAMPVKRCCRALLRNLANINAVDSVGRTAVDAAAEAGNCDLVSYLRGKGGVPGSHLKQKPAIVPAACAHQSQPQEHGQKQGQGQEQRQFGSPAARIPPTSMGRNDTRLGGGGKPASPGAHLLAGDDESKDQGQDGMAVPVLRRHAPTAFSGPAPVPAGSPLSHARLGAPALACNARGSNTVRTSDTSRSPLSARSGNNHALTGLADKVNALGSARDHSRLESPLSRRGREFSVSSPSQPKGSLIRGSGSGRERRRGRHGRVPGVSSPLARQVLIGRVGSPVGAGSRRASGVVRGGPLSPGIKWMR